MMARQALRRDRAAGGEIGRDDPAREQLKRQRQEAMGRVRNLRIRVRACSPEHRMALVVLQEALRAAEHQLAGIEAALAGTTPSEVVDAPDVDIVDEAAIDVLRRRLHLLELMLVNVPPSCTTPAKALRRAVGRELQSIERRRLSDEGRRA